MVREGGREDMARRPWEYSFCCGRGVLGGFSLSDFEVSFWGFVLGGTGN